MIVNGNQAVARIAFKTNEVCALYPITPASEMAELVEEWSSCGDKNIFGTTPSAIQMQSEAGVAGAMHGALQTGSLATTFTASQGLLLMMPNMYKIAGELTPNVIHVATRTVATHALSVFGDHSDIMAVRNTGYAFLGSASVQEAQDFALIAQAATLKSRIPFVHFFDGFRTSHEMSKIESISDEEIKAMIPNDAIILHRERALNPEKPVLRGTAQGPDVFFQSREAVNSIYNECPNIVQREMNRFFKLTGRQYKLFDYFGHPQATRIIISMASSTETVETTLDHLNKNGHKYGLIKVRLFRPFSSKHLMEALPKSVKSIAVLDRTKEPGAPGEPLYLDVVQSLSSAYSSGLLKSLPTIIGGRYGLSSKEFTPSMVNAIFKNLRSDTTKSNFSIGIYDDLTELSLDFSKQISFEEQPKEIVFHHKKTETFAKGLVELLKLIGSKENYVQAFEECNYKKSSSTIKTHLRIDNKVVKAPYLIENADFIIYEDVDILLKQNPSNQLKYNAKLLVQSSLQPIEFWNSLPGSVKHNLHTKNIDIYTADIKNLSPFNYINNHKVTALQTCYLALDNCIEDKDIKANLNESIKRVKTSYNISDKKQVLEDHFSETFMGKLLNNEGDEVPVSMISVDGTYDTNTSHFNKVTAEELPIWDMDLCAQCGACSMACPQAALRIKVYDDNYAAKDESHLKSVKALEPDWETDLLNYTIQVNPDMCNACSNCVDACSEKALKMTSRNKVLEVERQNWETFDEIPEFDRERINNLKVNQQQLQEPLFRYPNADEGCGEAPYLKLLSQLFGDRLLIANATGSSSIFGGALPTTPWSKNRNGRGPAWSNSLFEDNAEFGLGYRVSLDHQEEKIRELLRRLKPYLNADLVEEILRSDQTTEQKINKQRDRIAKIGEQLSLLNTQEARMAEQGIDSLIKKSVWIVGGDGWAYDIGFGGLDHAIASGRNVNILVLDNEVYDNTGGQTSKATPFGASAGFSYKGKQKSKKDLGLMAMTYKDVYVASVAIGADQEQTLKAFVEAEQFDGPSLIIAYSHSKSHGIDMKSPGKYHKAAVASGQWLLYRHDPSLILKKQKPLQLDSEVPSILLKEYLKLEKRYGRLISRNGMENESSLQYLQERINERFNKYKSMAGKEDVRKAVLY